ncbi:MAG: hypothetical protein RLZZ417_409 [Bacteroidota bacterium]
MKLKLLTIFLVCLFVSSSINIGVTITQLDKTILTIYQDKKSNYWFGSKENGVYYYNGQRLKHITTENGLVSNEIRGIQEDANGNIFFDTEKGVSKFDGLTFKTLQIANPASPLNNWILKPDDLWFRMGSTKSGAYRFDGKYLHYLKFPTSPQENMFYMKNPNTSLKPYGLYTIYKDRKGYMWFGTASLGVCRFDGIALNWHYEEQLQTTPNGGDFGTRAIFEDKNGKFWINNTRFRYVIETYGYKSVTFKKESGIGYLNKTNKMEFPFFLSITEDNKGNLWMATYENGVWKYNGKEFIHYPVKDGETDVLLFTIYKDNKGVLWLGTHNAGVYTFNGHSFGKFVK